VMRWPCLAYESETLNELKLDCKVSAAAHIRECIRGTPYILHASK
jgi:hypothetical protein